MKYLNQIDIQSYFNTGEIIYSGGGKSRYKITDILNNCIKISPTNAKTPSSLNYKKISIVIEGFYKINPKKIEATTFELLKTHKVIDTKNEVYLYGFAKEYIKRSINGLEMCSDVDLDSIVNAPTETYFEGKQELVSHLIRERNSKIIPLAKKEFRGKHGFLYCEICNFNFSNERKYGDSIIQGHHIMPVSKINDSMANTIDNIALLCPNCHQMIHRHMILYQEIRSTKTNIHTLKTIFGK
jgi:predicted HNH restriction endonuclease